MSVMEYSEILQRPIRRGNWADQVISTYQKILEAIERRDPTAAVELADYFMVEAKVCYDLYVGWLERLECFALQRDITVGEWRELQDRLSGLLKQPSGERFNAPQQWAALLRVEEAIKEAVKKGWRSNISGQAEQMREDWRQLHDRYVDLVDGTLTYIADRLGEETIDAAFRFILVPFFEMRYARFDIRRNDWEKMLSTNLYLCIEAMRGHLSGPRRWGEMELVEEPDRWVLRFDPCGSCGRAMRGCSIEKTPPRMEPPYNFHGSQKPYPWSWSLKGVDYYKVHVCYLFEILPIEKWGFPVRVVDTPSYPDHRCDKCVWYIYKDYRAVPQEVYARLGKIKPELP